MEKLFFSPQALQELEEKRNELAIRGTVCRDDVITLKENINMEEFTNGIEINKYTSVRSKVGVSTLLEEIDVLINNIKSEHMVTMDTIKDHIYDITSLLIQLAMNMEKLSKYFNKEENINLLNYLLDRKQALFYYNDVLTDMSKIDITHFEKEEYINYIRTLLQTQNETLIDSIELDKALSDLQYMDYIKVHNSNMIKMLLDGNISWFNNFNTIDTVDSFTFLLDNFISKFNKINYNQIPSLQEFIVRMRDFNYTSFNNIVKEFNDVLYGFFYNVLSTQQTDTKLLYELNKELTFFKAQLENVEFVKCFINNIENLFKLFK